MNGHKVLLSKHFASALIDAGIVPRLTRRVVIDAKLDEVVMVYVEQYGDERLLELTSTLDGVQIQYGPREGEA